MIRAHSLLLLIRVHPLPDQDICTEMLFLQEAMYRIAHLVRTIQIIQKISGIGWRPSADGIESLAIPHNMNQSDGLAFQTTTFEGQPIDKNYAEKRMRNEPLAEITQQKGTSETHPLLSPNDEWADFQIVQYYLDRENNKDPISVFRGGYYRDALLTGLKMQDNDGFNPYQLGAIGASDTHVAAAPFTEVTTLHRVLTPQ